MYRFDIEAYREPAPGIECVVQANHNDTNNTSGITSVMCRYGENNHCHDLSSAAEEQ